MSNSESFNLFKICIETDNYEEMRIILRRFENGECIYCGSSNMTVLEMKDLYCQNCLPRSSQCEESVIKELLRIINKKEEE